MGNSFEKPKENSEEFEEQHREEDTSSFTCEICIEPVPFNKRFKMNRSCNHHSYCLGCVAKYIQAKIEEYNVSEIKCPGLECEKLLDPLLCRSILSANLFVRWCDVLCESALSKHQKVYCPFPDCSSLILNECRGKVKKTKCPNCKKWLCFQCQLPWHTGYRCKETGEMRDRNDILLGQLMEDRKWRRCPACNHGVERHSGCPRITCRCGTKFCYVCGRRWCRCKWVLCNLCDQFFPRMLTLCAIIVCIMLWKYYHAR